MRIKKALCLPAKGASARYHLCSPQTPTRVSPASLRLPSESHPLTGMKREDLLKTRCALLRSTFRLQSYLPHPLLPDRLPACGPSSLLKGDAYSSSSTSFNHFRAACGRPFDTFTIVNPMRFVKSCNAKRDRKLSASRPAETYGRSVNPVLL